MTVPAPVPFLLTVTVIGGGITLNVAVTVAVVDTIQRPAPAQPPPFQPVKTEPASVVAVNVTRVPPGYVPVQSTPQVIPAGAEVTVPVPVPFLLIVTVKGVGAGRLKVAVTVAVVDTTQLPVPLHPPPFHPANTDPALAVAVNVTVVPPGKRSLQSPPQLIPAGVDATVPVPVPFLATITVNVGAMEFKALNAFSRRPVETMPFNDGTETPVLRMAFRI